MLEGGPDAWLSGKSSLQEAAPLVAVEEWVRIKLVSAGP